MAQAGETLYLSAGWLTDVLGGWTLGSLCLLLVPAASQVIGGRRADVSIPS